MKLGREGALRLAGCRCQQPEAATAGPWVVCRGTGCEAGYREDGATKASVQGTDAECHYCGRRASQGVALTRDHIVPTSVVVGAGRGQGARNIVLACGSCNRRKGALRSSCGCGKCAWAWRKWGPRGWESWETWAPKVVYTDP